MSHQIEITRDPRLSRHPGPPITSGEFRQAIVASDAFVFNGGFTLAIWASTRAREGRVALELAGGRIVASGFVEAMLPDMVRLARVLRADVVNETGDIYGLNLDDEILILKSRSSATPQRPPISDSTPTPTMQRQRKERPVIYGVGNVSCGVFLDTVAREPGARGPFIEWYTGFLSAWNLRQGSAGKPLLNFSMTKDQLRNDAAFLANFAKRNREKPFGLAVTALLDFHADRLAGQTRPETG